ncbi:hypothetical protein NUSPORA_01913 [Nucleospora cyclopteri]
MNLDKFDHLELRSSLFLEVFSRIIIVLMYFAVQQLFSRIYINNYIIEIVPTIINYICLFVLIVIHNFILRFLLNIMYNLNSLKVDEEDLNCENYSFIFSFVFYLVIKIFTDSIFFPYNMQITLNIMFTTFFIGKNLKAVDTKTQSNIIKIIILLIQILTTICVGYCMNSIENNDNILYIKNKYFL